MSLPKYPAYRPSRAAWLGLIPAHWRMDRLKRRCAAFPSNVDKKSVEGELPVRLCNYTDVYYNDTITSGMALMPATATPEQVEKFTLRAGDTVFTKDSETADDIGIAAYVPTDTPGVVCGYHLSIARPRHGVNGAYVKRLFDSTYTKACFAVRANGLTRVGLNQYAVDNVELPWAPVEEQGEIVAFLDRETTKIDALIAEQEKLLALLAEKRQATISRAVTRGLDRNIQMKNSDISWLDEVPAHWITKQLRNVANIVRGASPRPAGDSRFFAKDEGGDGYVPWVTVAEITKDASMFLSSVSEYLTALGADHSQRFEAGLVVFTNSGATLGVPKILDINCCANDGVLAFRDLSESVDSRFLYFFLLSTTERLRTEMKQGGGQPNLNTDIVKSIGFAEPPLDEQLEIVEFLEVRLREFAALEEELARAISLLCERRTALITAAVTGQIDVRGVVEASVAA